MREDYYRTCQGFIFTYSITSRSSFEKLTKIREEILRIRDKIMPMILVGNKIDLETSRIVKEIEGKELAKNFNCNFIETSAKDKINVEEAFFQLVREIREGEEVQQYESDLNEARNKKKKGNCFLL